jgi:hypothetical protein
MIFPTCKAGEPVNLFLELLFVSNRVLLLSKFEVKKEDKTVSLALKKSSKYSLMHFTYKDKLVHSKETNN